MITKEKIEKTSLDVLYRYFSIKKKFSNIHGMRSKTYFSGYIYTKKNRGFYVFCVKSVFGTEIRISDFAEKNNCVTFLN